MEATTDLTLVRLAGPELAILGATAEVLRSGLPCDASQTCPKTINGTYAAVHGIAYHARHDEAPCHALFDTCRPLLLEVERRLDLDEDWFGDWRCATGSDRRPRHRHLPESPRIVERSSY